MSIKSYAKSVIANKFALLSHLTPFVTAGMVYATSNTELQSIAAAGGTAIIIGSWWLTNCGRSTQKAYDETKKLIQEKGKIDENFQRWQGRFYCEETGMYLAARELGVEDQLPKRTELGAIIRALKWAFIPRYHYDELKREKIREQLEEDDNLASKIQQLAEVTQ